MSKLITKEYIKTLLNPIEANVVGCLWKDVNLYFDYSDLNAKMFKNERWKFYFGIGKKIISTGVKVLDDVAVETYININRDERVQYAYDNFGGIDTVSLVSDVLNTENVEGYIQEFKKLISIYDFIENLTFTENNFKEIKDLNIDELYDYINAQMNQIFINTGGDANVGKLDEGLEDLIELADKGLDIGIPFNSPMLSEEIGGLIRGQVILVGGLSGAGKTTMVIESILSAMWENEVPVVAMLNEQDISKWKQQILTWIINNKIKNKDEKKFNSKRWRQGSFTEEEKECLYKATQLLKSKMDNNEIIIVEFKSYSQKKAERVIRKYASLGFKNFILDTFKLSSDRNDNEAFWLSMQEDMRRFDDLVKKSNLNVNLVCTLQLQKGSVLKRYLTGDNIGMAKNVMDVASVGLLMRRVRNDEYPGEKFELEVIRPIKGTSSGQKVILDPKKKYVIIFIEKNRNGDSQNYQIVAEQHLGYLIYKEVGICDIPFDS